METDQASDELLISRFCAGSDKAFTKLYHRYKPRLLGLLFDFVGEHAEDLCHDVFERVIRNANSFSSNKASFSTWFYTISKNTALVHLRDRKQTNPLADVRANKDHTIRLNEVSSMVDNLPAKYKDTLILYAYRGFSYEEISVICDISIGTVKSRIARARNKIT